MTWTCPTCGTGNRKDSRNKYCSRTCSNAGRRIIDRALVKRLILKGFTYAEMALYIPATGQGISNAMTKERARA